MNGFGTRPLRRMATALGLTVLAAALLVASAGYLARLRATDVSAAAPDQSGINPQTAPLPAYDAVAGARNLAFEIPLHFASRTSVVIGPPALRPGPAQSLRTAPRQLAIEVFDRAGARIQSIYAWHPLRTEHAAVPGPTFEPPRLDAADADGLSQTDPRKYSPYHLFRDAGDGLLYIPYDPRASTVRIVDLTLGDVELGRVSVEGAARRYCALAPAAAFCREGPTGIGGVSRSTLYFEPYTMTVGSNAVFTVALKARRMVDLYAGQLAVTFDPAVVQVVDQDPGRPGAQIVPGDFPKPDSVLRNATNNAAGRLEYYFTLTGEKPGVNGTGTVAQLVLRGVGAGQTLLAVTQTVLSDPQSLEIPTKRENALITVLDGPVATVTGQVELERRPTNAGAQVCSSGRCATTDAAGRYTLANIPVGLPVEVSHPSYLRASRVLPASATGTTTWPKVRLLAGDFDKDDRVEIVDAVMIGQRFNLRDDATPRDPRWLDACDITDDDAIDILDMVGVQFNLLKTAPGPWPATYDASASAEPAALAQATRVELVPGEARADGLDADIPLELRVADVDRLYGYRVRLSFDPTKLRVVDVSPSDDGVQVAISEFLDAINSFVLLNRADNAVGTVDISITQTAPAEGVTGSGVLATVTFRGLVPGVSQVDVTEAVLVDDTLPIPATLANQRAGATVTIGSATASWAINLPWLNRR